MQNGRPATKGRTKGTGRDCALSSEATGDRATGLVIGRFDADTRGVLSSEPSRQGGKGLER